MAKRPPVRPSSAHRSRTSRKPVPSAREEIRTQKRAPIRTIVADDDGGLAAAIAARLEADPEHLFAVAATVDPLALERLIRRHRPHLLIVDERFDWRSLSFEDVLAAATKAKPGIHTVVVHRRPSPTSRRLAAAARRLGAKLVFHKRGLLTRPTLPAELAAAAIEKPQRRTSRKASAGRRSRA